MNIAMLGTGRVTQVISPKLSAAGHHVVLGSRDPQAQDHAEWVAQHDLEILTHTAAVSSSELIINALPGGVALEILMTLNLAGKVVMDIANAAKFHDGHFDLVYPNSSLGAELQKALPDAYIVKAMSTMSTSVMQNPTALSAPGAVFVSGNSLDAKQTVIRLLRDLGWPQNAIIDLGDINTARGPEHTLLLMAALYGTFGTPQLNIAISR